MIMGLRTIGDNLRQLLQKGLLSEWLSDKVVHSGIATRLDVVGERICGQCDDWFAYGGYHRFFEHGGEGAYQVHRPDHWVFEGTGLKQGDLLGAIDKIVGYECDGCRFTLDGGLPVPAGDDGTPQTFTILGTAPAWLSAKDNSLLWVSEALYGKGTSQRIEQPGAAVMGAYTRGGTVFTTGCTEWVRGLSGRDPTVTRITRNVLDRLSQRG